MEKYKSHFNIKSLSLSLLFNTKSTLRERKNYTQIVTEWRSNKESHKFSVLQLLNLISTHLLYTTLFWGWPPHPKQLHRQRKQSLTWLLALTNNWNGEQTKWLLPKRAVKAEAQTNSKFLHEVFGNPSKLAW